MNSHPFTLFLPEEALGFGRGEESGMWLAHGVGSGNLSYMRSAYKVRAYPDPGQAIQLGRTFGCVRLVWNKTLAERQAARIPPSATGNETGNPTCEGWNLPPLGVGRKSIRDRGIPGQRVECVVGPWTLLIEVDSVAADEGQVGVRGASATAGIGGYPGEIACEA